MKNSKARRGPDGGDSNPRKGARRRPAKQSGGANVHTMTVTGRVFGTDGKPVAGAAVDIIGAARAPEVGSDLESNAYVPLGRGVSEGDGRLCIEAARTSSWRFLQVCAVASVMTPGAATIGFADRGDLQADAAYLPNVNRRLVWREFSTDADGCITLTALIPGASYRISDWSTVNVQGKRYELRKEFTVNPGEMLDLGHIFVERPEL